MLTALKNTALRLLARRVLARGGKFSGFESAQMST
jgi:hypothetical protein